MTAVGISAQARARPDKVALIAGDRRLTFGELDARAGRAARAFARLGLTAGGRIAIAAKNRPEFFEAAVAAARLGAEAVPMSWRLRTDEARYIVEDSGATILLAETEAAIDLPRLSPAEYEELLAREQQAGDEAVPGSGGDPPISFRYYTSGTTGRPKAVERERRDVERYLEGVRAQLRHYGVDGPEEVHLVCGPLSHSGPSSFANYALMLGQTVVLMDRFEAGECLRLIEWERVTWTFMAPVHFVRLLALGERVRDSDLSTIRRVLHAGAPCPPSVKRRIMEAFPPGTVWEFYGATEGRGTVISPDEWLRRPGSVGRPVAGARVKILDPSGNELPPGAVGLVYVSPIGGARFVYAGDPEKTAQAWRGEFYTVGDMGYLDGDGYLYLTDRAQDMIITGGVNVYPAEIEAVLHQHPAVTDVAVIGVPDDEWGESVKAIVEARAPVTEPELVGFCRERLATYKCPRTIDFVETLPRGDDGKVRKRELREPFWAGRATRV